MSVILSARPVRATIETRDSWIVCLTALGITAVSFAAPTVNQDRAAGRRAVPAHWAVPKRYPAPGTQPVVLVLQHIEARHNARHQHGGWARPVPASGSDRRCRS